MQFQNGWLNTAREWILAQTAKAKYTYDGANTTVANIASKSITDDGGIAVTFRIENGTNISKIELLAANGDTIVSNDVAITRNPGSTLLYRFKITLTDTSI